MTEEMVSFRGMRVSADWPRRLRDAQLSTTCRRNGVEMGRVRYGDERHAWGAERRPCHDCAAARGEFHVPGCDVEECPACGGQMLGGCDCEWPDDEEEE
ncbi:MAG: hypothetical protein MUE73_17780 [Planctomycetes bacterium]|jgi:hypothetical protein|nr:hypothetical protein [Planctomycetota bacterium]